MSFETLLNPMDPYERVVSVRRSSKSISNAPIVFRRVVDALQFVLIDPDVFRNLGFGSRVGVGISSAGVCGKDPAFSFSANSSPR